MLARNPRSPVSLGGSAPATRSDQVLWVKWEAGEQQPGQPWAGFTHHTGQMFACNESRDVIFEPYRKTEKKGKLIVTMFKWFYSNLQQPWKIFIVNELKKGWKFLVQGKTLARLPPKPGFYCLYLSLSDLLYKLLNFSTAALCMNYTQSQTLPNSSTRVWVHVCSDSVV